MSDDPRIETAEPTAEEFPTIHFRLRANTAKNTPDPGLLEAASRDRSAFVRDTVAANPCAPRDAFRRLSASDRSGTRGLWQ